METIISYFLLNDAKKDISSASKERTMVLYLLVMFAVSIITIPIYIYAEMNMFLKFICFLFVGSSALLIYFKISHNLKVASYLFVSICFIFFFLNILYSGGINSSLVIWIAFLPIFAITLNDTSLIQYTIVNCLLLLSIIILFHYYSYEFPNEMKDKFGTYYGFTNHINFMAFIITIVYFYDKRKKLDTQKLEQSNRDLEQFAYVASHDMKAPLRNIMNFAQLLSRINKGKIDADSEKYIQYILSNGYQMNELIQGILDISKIDKQESSVYSHTDLNEVLIKVKSNLSNQLNKENIIIETKRLPTVSVNEPQIIQVFQNLIENGLKYNQNEQRKITISHQEDKQFFYIYIKDNGIGIAPEFFDKIFEMFKRLHSGYEYKGTGIGLAICKKIALRHKGDLVVDSSSNEGTVFRLSLPK
ncbi:MAG: ATP-binding protein [Saprospiraceae bacterium]